MIFGVLVLVNLALLVFYLNPALLPLATIRNSVSALARPAALFKKSPVVLYDKIFLHPGWNPTPNRLQLLSGGKGAVFFSHPEARWTMFSNQDSSSWFTVRGDFEVDFKLDFGRQNDVGENYALLSFNAKADTSKSGDVVFIRISRNNQGFMRGGEEQAATSDDAPRFALPKSGRIKVRFEKVNNKTPEVVSLWDIENNKEIVRLPLSFVLFKPNTKLSFAFNSGDAISFFSVNDFLILSDKKDSVTGGL